MSISPAIAPFDIHTAPYPDRASERDSWVLAHRPERNALDPFRPYAYLVEDEPGPDGSVLSVATIFLTNRECPWRCVMCDLWQNTLANPTPQGVIPAQIDYALAHLEPARAIKLYNAGSFFDPRAIPPDDYPAIADRVRSFDRVIVECHPALVNDAVLRFRDLLQQSAQTSFEGARLQPCRTDRQEPGALAPEGTGPQLEVAMGLETAHPGVLEKLNKRVTLGQFRAAAEFLRIHNVALRVFILVQPPFMRADESLYWAERSLDFAFGCGATAATLIPTRGGNGAMEALAASGDFAPPSLATLESAVAYGIGHCRGRVFSDLWDLPRAIDCPVCRDARVARLRAINVSQALAPPVPCAACGGTP